LLFPVWHWLTPAGPASRMEGDLAYGSAYAPAEPYGSAYSPERPLNDLAYGSAYAPAEPLDDLAYGAYAPASADGADEDEKPRPVSAYGAADDDDAQDEDLGGSVDADGPSNNDSAYAYITDQVDGCADKPGPSQQERARPHPVRKKAAWEPPAGVKQWQHEFSTFVQEFESEGTAEAKARALQAVSGHLEDFFYTCEQYGRLIIDEMSREQKSIAGNSALGGIAGGDKFIVAGILFKVPSDVNFGPGGYLVLIGCIANLHSVASFLGPSHSLLFSPRLLLCCVLFSRLFYVL
jgi:hypothetical protein